METDAPYMVPTTLPAKELGMTSKQRFPFSTASVLPWSAQYVAQVLNEGKGDDDRKWTTVDVLRQARKNAALLYKI
jgi:TatD DNase family protein